MTELVVALLMIVQGEIKEARIQPSMSECLKGKRVAKRGTKPDGHVKYQCIKSEILDHARMNKPGQGFYKVLAESALRAIKLCQPLRVPTTGPEK